MLGLAPHAAALRNVRVRSAERDVLRVRHRVERALAAVDWMPPGLPPGAILVMRRLAAPSAPAARMQGGFAERVSAALREQAQRARWPWLQADAFDADAVVFADEAEMFACLARDWLRGRVAQCWWWRTVLAGADPPTWLRQEATRHSGILVPALSLLARRAQAVAWVESLDADDCRLLFGAVARAHALPLARVSLHPDPVLARGVPAEAESAELKAAWRALEAAPLRRLVQEVPELQATRSGLEQRRLLALVLSLVRAPTWVRTPAFAAALEALDRVDGAGLTWLLAAPVHPARRQLAPDRRVKESAADVVREAAERRTRAGEAPAIDNAARSSASRLAIDNAGECATESAEAWADLEEAAAAPSGPSGRPRVHERPPEVDVGGQELPGFNQASASPVAIHEALPAPAAPAALVGPSDLDIGARVDSHFGGIFYLLNAALAMGLYVDFTAPRAANLELSPWDWLALVGREWFGEEFVGDPVWSVLAELAGRAPEEAPERDFQPPSDDWLDEHLQRLRARLAQALDPGEGVDVRAFVCRHPARVEVSSTTLHVFLSLARLDLAIRIAGLDRDTGWIPAAGRDVRFHFD
jgi:hypothetical protein